MREYVSDLQSSLQHCQQPLLDRFIHLFALSQVGGSPDLICIHASWDCVCFEKPNLSMQSIGKVMVPNTSDTESASRKWSQGCISCNIQVESFVKHQA